MNEWSELARVCEVRSSRGARASAWRTSRLRPSPVIISGLLAPRTERAVARGTFNDSLSSAASRPQGLVSRGLIEAAQTARPKSSAALPAMDEWVQAFQGSDPARKSRGAYATPQVARHSHGAGVVAF